MTIAKKIRIGVICGLFPFVLTANDLIIENVTFYGQNPIVKLLDKAETDSAAAIRALKLDANPKSMKGEEISLSQPLPASEKLTTGMLGFSIENRDYTKAKVNIEGLNDYLLYVDGKKVESEDIVLLPATHEFGIRYIAKPGADNTLKITISTDKENVITQRMDGKRFFVLDDVLYGTKISNAQISPSGDFILVTYNDIEKNGKSATRQTIFDAKKSKKLMDVAENAKWMPKSNCLLVERNDYENGRHLVAINPKDMSQEILVVNMPVGPYQMAPSEDFLVYTLTKEGEKKDSQVYQITEPDDRQPGWRDKSYPAIYELRNGAQLSPLTSGEENAWIADISDDGKQLLLMTVHSRLEKRPTTVMSLMLVERNTMKVDTLVIEDGFISSAKFSPDGKQALVFGSPEALGRIGCQLPEGVYPNMTEQELFIIDLNTKNQKPITKEFDPSIEQAYWSRYDGQIYVRAEEKDYYAIYKIDPKTGKADRLAMPENIVKGISISESQPVMAVWGQSDSNPDRVYLYNIKSQKPIKLDDPSACRLQDVKLATCQDWNFLNSKGDSICGRFYLPDNFDPAKKYPLIVNYYGGCSPTQRMFESRYPFHAYAPLGYVVYVIQPSGATGFGQEFASRHVNTAGQGVAEDIIEGTKQFIAEHPYVDAERVGCIGASYGGFMTQYLQTVTDIFACAISHAGISDHTSYWGEGYWGYSYSEVSMAGSYPWSDQELYVKQSPLYNADKVNTPILFLHGDVDSNVPVGESIQMFTALKLLGKDAALVQVADQNHHIMDFEKRTKWQNTIWAWFAKYLKDDPEWWNSMYK